MNKEQFCEIINDLKTNEDFISSFNNIFRDFNKEERIYSTGLEETVVKMLEIIFNDTETKWISYWIWEKNFGDTYEDGDVTYSDGTIISLKNAEELYEFLIHK